MLLSRAAVSPLRARLRRGGARPATQPAAEHRVAAHAVADFAATEHRVLVSADGRLVCKTLVPGVYTVASWQAGGNGRASAFPAAPACDSGADVTRSCAMFCTLNEQGDLICSGVEEGVYEVVAADPAEAVRRLSFAPNGAHPPLQCSFDSSGAAHCKGNEHHLDEASENALHRPLNFPTCVRLLLPFSSVALSSYLQLTHNPTGTLFCTQVFYRWMTSPSALTAAL